MLLKTETERNKLKPITEKALRLYSTNYFNRTILVINIFSAPVLVVEGNAQRLFLLNVIPLTNTRSLENFCSIFSCCPAWSK